jgi:RNA polymerase sigma-70 factor (ECF subfamily)
MVLWRSTEVRLGDPATAQVDVRDGVLIELAISGDRDAFDALIRPRLDRLFRLSLSITRSHADARDAVQEACIQTWRELPRLRDRGRFDAWLNQIIVNAARMHVRGRSRARVREISRDEDDQPRRLEPSVPSNTETVADSDAIRRAFGRLDGTTRALLVMHYVQGTPLADIARTVGAPVGTIKWRLSNARKALERALEAEQR